jgi:hypothetical protein
MEMLPPWTGSWAKLRLGMALARARAAVDSKRVRRRREKGEGTAEAPGQRGIFCLSAYAYFHI